jgi:hypothetical protein
MKARMEAGIYQQQCSGLGELIFPHNGAAAVKCEFRQSESGGLRGTVLHAEGHPYWHPILLLHPPGPYRLVTSDGHKFDVTFESLQGDVRAEYAL